ncbi:hypothetical protein ABVK25_006535 [Lepraria finkii]|uniref:Uncharacterized protein n=1 Tax=Lepraria finkii TaxID=1340010 RepID=A0ABR4B5R9_9LECA
MDKLRFSQAAAGYFGALAAPSESSLTQKFPRLNLDLSISINLISTTIHLVVDHESEVEEEARSTPKA